MNLDFKLLYRVVAVSESIPFRGLRLDPAAHVARAGVDDIIAWPIDPGYQLPPLPTVPLCTTNGNSKT
jgi:hypothetical protein